MKHPLFSLQDFSLNNTIKMQWRPIPDEQIIQDTPFALDVQKMGLLILAGGDGARLGFKGPKGCFPLPLPQRPTLFQLLFEKIKQQGSDLSVAVMTSSNNDGETKTYLKKFHYFGLNPNYIDIFQQGDIPLCDQKGEMFFASPGKLAKGGDGNGRAFFYFRENGLDQKWLKRGIEVIQVIPVDNPLCQPFDMRLLTLHETRKVDIVIQAIQREDPKEALGVLGLVNHKLHIAEYSELTAHQALSKHDYPLGYSGIFSCFLNFAQKGAELSLDLPWHIARKRAKQWHQRGDHWEMQEMTSCKFETFIFDLFPYAQSHLIHLIQRESSFAPLKERTGENAPEAVAQKVQRYFL